VLTPIQIFPPFTVEFGFLIREISGINGPKSPDWFNFLLLNYVVFAPHKFTPFQSNLNLKKGGKIGVCVCFLHTAQLYQIHQNMEWWFLPLYYHVSWLPLSDVHYSFPIWWKKVGVKLVLHKFFTHCPIVPKSNIVCIFIDGTFTLTVDTSIPYQNYSLS
jgi:hypothetical protein